MSLPTSRRVPTAYEVANALECAFELIIVRKIQIPGNTEAGLCAVGPDGEVILNEILLSRLGLTDEKINRQIEKTKRVVETRNQEGKAILLRF